MYELNKSLTQQCNVTSVNSPSTKYQSLPPYLVSEQPHERFQKAEVLCIQGWQYPSPNDENEIVEYCLKPILLIMFSQ